MPKVQNDYDDDYQPCTTWLLLLYYILCTVLMLLAASDFYCVYFQTYLTCADLAHAYGINSSMPLLYNVYVRIFPDALSGNAFVRDPRVWHIALDLFWFGIFAVILVRIIVQSRRRYRPAIPLNNRKCPSIGAVAAMCFAVFTALCEALILFDIYFNLPGWEVTIPIDRPQFSVAEVCKRPSQSADYTRFMVARWTGFVIMVLLTFRVALCKT